jgi:ubiquinol-cytochrome c reductase cytochrome b subunit
MPFAIVGLAIAHIALLHKDGSSNPIGIDSSVDKIPFFPYFYFKDLFSIFVFIVFFSIFIYYYPNLLGHSDNYIPANSMVTPSHIVPE